MLSLFLRLSSCNNRSIVLRQCKPTGIFTITHFNFASLPDSPGSIGRFSFTAEMVGAANSPYVEIILTKKRIPEVRMRYSLCELGLIKCPTNFAVFNFGTQFTVPKTSAQGKYRMKILFIDDHIKTGCFEVPITIF